MSADALVAHAGAELQASPPPGVATLGRTLAEARGAAAVLFYGSALRTGDLDGVLDYYLLMDGPHRTGLHGLLERWFWPEVSYHEVSEGGRLLRAKAATLPLSVFRRAAEGAFLDTTIWARFVQPAALIWARDGTVRGEVEAAVAGAVVTASGFAAGLGPEAGAPEDFWTALFKRTYAAEVRVETPGREAQILAFEPDRYRTLLPLGWAAGGLAFDADAGRLSPRLTAAERAKIQRRWRARRLAGRFLGVARLAKAAFTFEGATRYAAWKIERHTGVHIPVTPWRERHPLLTAPIALWKLARARRQAR